MSTAKWNRGEDVTQLKYLCHKLHMIQRQGNLKKIPMASVSFFSLATADSFYEPCVQRKSPVIVHLYGVEDLGPVGRITPKCVLVGACQVVAEQTLTGRKQWKNIV